MNRVLTTIALCCASLAPAPAAATTPPPLDCGPYMGRALAELEQLARHTGIEDHRAASCLAIEFAQHRQQSLPVLSAMLASGNERLMTIAALGVGMSEPAIFRQALPALLQAYAGSGSPRVRIQVENTLLMFPRESAAALPLLLRELKNPRTTNDARFATYQAYARLAEANGDAVASLAMLLSSPDIPVGIQSDAASHLARIGAPAHVAADLKALIARLLAANDRTHAANLFQALTRIDGVEDAASFLVRQAARYPDMAQTIQANMRELKTRDAAAVGTTLLAALRTPGTMITAAGFLRALADTDAAMAPTLDAAALRLAAMLHDDAIAGEAARSLYLLRHSAPGAAAPLAGLAARHAQDRARQMTFLRALSVVGGQTEEQLRILLHEAVRQLREPAPQEKASEGACDAIRALMAVERLPAAFVPVLKNAFFHGLHETNRACGVDIVRALRNADTPAGIDAQLDIFLSPRLVNVCDASLALTPRHPGLTSVLVKRLARAGMIRQALLEKAIADSDGGARMLRPHADRLRRQLAGALARPRSTAERATDREAERLGLIIATSNDGPSYAHWCGIPGTRVGLAIYRIGNLRMATPAIIGKLVAALDNPDPMTRQVAGDVLRRIADRADLARRLRKAAATSGGARALLAEIGR